MNWSIRSSLAIRSCHGSSSTGSDKTTKRFTTGYTGQMTIGPKTIRTSKRCASYDSVGCGWMSALLLRWNQLPWGGSATVPLCNGSDKAVTILNPTNNSRELATLKLVLLALLGPMVFLALYTLRAMDDNSLTSWQWVFAEVNVGGVFVLIVLGAVVAYAISRLHLSERYAERYVVVSLVACSSLIGMVLWEQPEVIVDTSRYFAQAKHLAVYGAGSFFTAWGGQIEAWTDLPLVPALFGLVFSLFGEDRVFIQVLNTLFFSGTVVLTYLIGKTVWNHRLGCYAGFLLLGMPYLLSQVPLMLVDVPTMFFMTLVVYLAIQAFRLQAPVYVVLATVAIVLALLAKYSTWLLLSVVPVIATCYLADRWQLAAKKTSLMVLGAGLMIGLFILLKFDAVAAQFQLLYHFQVPGLQRWQEGLVSSFLFQIHPFISIAALCSIGLAVKRRDIRFVMVSWLPILLLLLDVERMRYWLPVLPMVALMAAYGLSSLQDKTTSRFLVATTVITAMIVAVFAYLPFLQSTSHVNLSRVGAYLDSLDADKIEVVTLPQSGSMVNPAVVVPMLDLYTHKDLVYRYDAPEVPAGMATSSLRFTWLYRNPRYYQSEQDSGAQSMPLALIGGRDQIVPERLKERIRGYQLVKQWLVSDRVFKYQTMVQLYEPVETLACCGFNQSEKKGYS